MNPTDVVESPAEVAHGTDVALGAGTGDGAVRTTVRDHVFDVLRRHGMMQMFANPGSTEIPLLANTPADIDFVLALHEASVIGMAAGVATATGKPSLALLHTTAGLGNAVAAIATVRENHVPMVILVGQQDRRHLVSEPFLSGKLDGLAGQYPVWVTTPSRPEDLPVSIERAIHEATVHRGPAIVIVPMDDWQREMPPAAHRQPVPQLVRRAENVSLNAHDEVRRLLVSAERPVIIVGADAADESCWRSLATIAEKTGAPIWNEPFGARPGFDQTSPLFAGFLSPSRDILREQLCGHDAVLVVGCHALRQYGFVEGALFDAGRVAVVVADADQAMASATDVAVIAPLPSYLAALSETLPPRAGAAPAPVATATAAVADGRFSARHLLHALSERVPRDVVLVEEAPSARSDINAIIPAATPLGFVSAAMGGLGFGLPAAAGLKLALPQRPVVAILGDGSSLYSIQGLWSAQRYELGVLYVIIENGGYAIMDRLAAQAESAPVWPRLNDIGFPRLAEGFGCDSAEVHTPQELNTILDEVVPTLAERTSPFVLVVHVER